MLSIEHALEKRATQYQGDISGGNGPPEDCFEDIAGLGGIELRAVYQPAGRLEQACLQQLHRGSDAKQQSEWDPRTPRAGTDLAAEQRRTDTARTGRE